MCSTCHLLETLAGDNRPRLHLVPHPAPASGPLMSPLSIAGAFIFFRFSLLQVLRCLLCPSSNGARPYTRTAERGAHLVCVAILGVCLSWKCGNLGSVAILLR